MGCSRRTDALKREIARAQAMLAMAKQVDEEVREWLSYFMSALN